MSAIISNCQKYRYLLEREVRAIPMIGDRGLLLWIMLNPSTADANNNDQTIRKCIGFSSRNNFSRFRVVNLFAYRATKPADLWRARDPIGPENNEHIVNAAIDAKVVVVAWGNHKKAEQRAKQVVEMLANMLIQPLCLGKNNNGSPRHPCMIPYSQALEEF